MQTALLVIDVQNGFINKSLKSLPNKIANLIKLNKFDHVLLFKFVNKSNSNWTKVLGWDGMMSSEEVELAPELIKYINEKNVFIKETSFSAFDSKEFLDYLKENKIDTMYICGLDTHACVLVTAMEAFTKNYDVKVIEDLCASSHGKNFHDMAIEILTSNLSKDTIIKSSDLG